MSTLRSPIGPQPPSVYWRRRLLVLLGIVAVIVVIILLITKPGSGSGTPATSPSNSADPSTDPSSDPSDGPTDPSDAEACDPSVITLDPITDAESYSSEVQPLISMAITNTGATACTIDAGTKQQEYLIMSGSDRIWSSTDCQTDGASLPIVLEPGKSQETTPFPWDRTRSSTTTCNDDRKQVTAGGATYRLSVKLGEIKSEGDTPFILK